MAERYLIGPENQSGLQTNVKSWKIHNEAYTILQNMYVFRGRIRKRFGSFYTGATLDPIQAPLFSQTAIQVGTTNGAGALAGTVPGSIFAVGQKFSIAGEIFTVFNGAAGANPMLDTGAAVTKTFNLATGAFVFAGAAINTAVFWYPGEPIMGLTIYEFGPINNQPAHAFDTQTGYFFNGTRWLRSGATKFLILHDPQGTKNHYVWAYCADPFTTNTIPLMFISNFQILNPNGIGAVTDDPIWYFDGTDWQFYGYQPDAVINPTNIQPKTVTRTRTGAPTIITNYIQSARIIVSFKDRLLLLNTIENNNNEVNGAGAATPITPASYLTSINTNYAQRCRFTHKGNPLTATAWLEANQTYNPGTGAVNADGSGYIDAATEEQIVSAEFIKDRLIVYFERSTWEIVATGNPVAPFAFQKINTELGSEATFSVVPFDKMILNWGFPGIMGCTGANIERIDNKVPDEAFEVQQERNGINRVQGIRDYKTEMVYWTFPSIDVNNGVKSYNFPDQILVYNYKVDAWALNDDVITAFGYFEQATSSLTWQQMNMTWEQATQTWNSGVRAAEPRKVLAGNQEGYIYVLDPDETSNAQVMTITNMDPATSNVTIINHQLLEGDFIYISNANGTNIVNNTIFKVVGIVDADNIIIGPAIPAFTGVYTGGGVAGRVSNINIVTKLFNPYDKENMNVAINKIDFLVDKTGDPDDGGELTIDYYVSSNQDFNLLPSAIATNTAVATGQLQTSPYTEFPLETGQERLWRTAYIQAFGNGIQLDIYMTDTQMLNPTIAWADIQIHAYILNIMRAGRLQ